MDHTIIVNDYRLMDKLIKEERAYLINMLKKIKKAGCNVLLIQKSILRDAVTTESLAILSKLKIAVIKDIERDEIDFLSRSLGCKPVSDIDAFTDDKLGYAELVEETLINECKVVKITGIRHAVGSTGTGSGSQTHAAGASGHPGGGAGARGGTVSILAMGSNQLVLDETERSLHDALCVVRCLVKKRLDLPPIASHPALTQTPCRALIAGGGAPEIHVSRLLSQHAQTLKGMEAYCFQAYADALEIIPTTLAENAGLNPIAIVTELRNRHAKGERNAGINVRKVSLSRFLCPSWRHFSHFVLTNDDRASSQTFWRKTLCSLS